MQSIKFITLGCKVNQYDTQEIRERFLEAGFKESENSSPADIYLINTCSVTHKADRESLYCIHRAQRENPKAKIIVTGCLTELDSETIRRQPGVQLIVKNKEKNRIIKLFNELTHQRTPALMHSSTQALSGISYFKNHTRAFLKIQDGCNNFCSYCKVPLVRGRSRSKPQQSIVQEAARLVNNGFREIVLTGICLGAYGKDLAIKKDLVDVISALEKINGLLRIRLSSIEAVDVTLRLIRKMASSRKLCRHLHIPIQSGDDAILRKMQRKYSSRDYLKLIKIIRSFIPEIAITTDVLVGFPGEKDEHFRQTLGLVAKIRPQGVHIFPFSPREHTLADKFTERVSHDKVKLRITQLKKLAQGLADTYRKKFLGRKLEVLIEDRVNQNNKLFEGYTDNYLRVTLKSKIDLKNQIISLKLSRIKKDCIEGVL